MLSSLYRILISALKRGAVFIFLASLVLTTHGLWLFVHDESNPEDVREARLAELAAERQSAEEEGRTLDNRLQEHRADVAAQRERHERAGRVLEILRSLQSRWERWFGDREQQEANARQMTRLREIQKESRARIGELERAVRMAMRERMRVDAALDQLDYSITSLQTRRSPLAHYAFEVWHRDRWWLLAAAVAFFLGGFLSRALIYFILAPTVVRGRPLRFFAGEPGPQPEVSSSARELSVALWPGEVLRLKSAFLSDHEPGMATSVCWFLDARLPFTSMLSGWFRPLGLHNRRAGGEARVQLAVPAEMPAELALVQIPEGGSFIARPSQVVGMVRDANARLVIRKRFRPFHWQSWATMQFRFFEFVGPCRLVLCGGRPLRMARLSTHSAPGRTVRRLPKRATVGFSPSLEYQPVRSNRFWAYSRGRSPLFDSALAGEGVVLFQEPGYSGSGFRHRLKNARHAALKLIGI